MNLQVPLFIKAFQDEINRRTVFSVRIAVGIAFQITGPLQPIVGSCILPKQNSRSSRIISMSICNFNKIVLERPRYEVIHELVGLHKYSY